MERTGQKQYCGEPWVHPTFRRFAGGHSGKIQDGLGNTDEGAHRHGGGPRGVYLPEPESEFVVGRPELFDPDVDAFLCLVEGTQDGDLLFETPGAASGATIHHRTGEENGG